MEHYELIRRKVVIEGKSQRDVVEELRHSRKTIAKALELRIPPGYRLIETCPSQVIKPVRHIIDAWLEQNKHARPKQRQTGQRIYGRIRDEYGFKGHNGTVQRYIRGLEKKSLSWARVRIRLILQSPFHLPVFLATIKFDPLQTCEQFPNGALILMLTVAVIFVLVIGEFITIK